MKTIYTLTIRVMNGTVTMSVITDCFTSKELAEKTEEAVKKKNKEHVITSIDTTNLYESEDEIPILKNGHN